VPADHMRERGSAAVEFALLLPILLLLLLAFVQVGVIARDSLVLTQASRAGARDKLYNLQPGGAGPCENEQRRPRRPRDRNRELPP
jgi:hypothetical protein